ncbi:MAG: ThuA domain-containing protein [Acidobacteria bacterium]|nr:ThuA domain-containing protein [Acidobacteriota bacterium]
MKSGTVSRRILLGAGIAALARPLIARAKATAFALIGDRYHNSDYIRTGLGRTIGGEPGVSIDFCDETKMLDAETLEGYRLLIMLRDGMTWPGGYPDERTNAGWLASGSPPLASEPPVPKSEAKPHYWITAGQGRAVKQFVEGGGAALLLHNVTYISPHNRDFRDVLGAVTEGHPPIRKFRGRVLNREHPITRGVNNFLVTDEQHYVRYEKDPRRLLLESVNEDGAAWKDLGTRSAAGWAYDYGKGRVCYLAPGHLLTALWNPEYVKLQKNAVRWLLRRE